MAFTETNSREPSLPLTLVFPMAGRGERFGTTFKPFLRVGEQAFIEAAVQPFRKWQSSVSRVLFVFLETQEQDFSVTRRLGEMFDQQAWQPVVLERPTAGPAETMYQAVERAGAVGPAIVCDCDHAVNVDPMFEALRGAEPPACMLPVWDMAGEDVKSWSVAAVDDDGTVSAIAEKAVPEGARRTAGVIGCYYFRDIAQTAAICRREGYLVISQVVEHLIRAGERVVAVPIAEASFFGDPARLAEAVKAGAPSDPSIERPSQ